MNVYSYLVNDVKICTFPDNDLLELVRAVQQFEEELPKLDLSSRAGQRQETAVVFFVEIGAACNIHTLFRILSIEDM